MSVLFIENFHKRISEMTDISDCRNFILLDTSKIKPEANVVYDEKFSLPFDCCYFEFAFINQYGNHGLPCQQQLNTGGPNNLFMRSTSAIYLFQNSLDELTEIKITRPLYSQDKEHTIVTTKTPFGDVLSCEASFVYSCLTNNNCLELGKSRVVHRYKDKNGSKKINQIVYIRPKHSSASLMDREIEWTHKFEVRGHWRKISATTIGKDRSGAYKLKGCTWVNEYIKGEGKLVIKTRALKGQSNGVTQKEINYYK